MFYVPSPEPLDCKIFSPLHSQVAELAPCMPYSVNSANGHCGGQFQSGTNEADAYISQFLDSVLNNSGEDLYCEDLVTQKKSLTDSETDGLFYHADEGMAKAQVSRISQVFLVLCCEIVINFESHFVNIFSFALEFLLWISKYISYRLMLPLTINCVVWVQVGRSWVQQGEF